jgi:hypothetical protein
MRAIASEFNYELSWEESGIVSRLPPKWRISQRDDFRSSVLSPEMEIEMTTDVCNHDRNIRKAVTVNVK